MVKIRDTDTPGSNQTRFVWGHRATGKGCRLRKNISAL
nr:MAG TPA: hypothetical protein [Caudoviricetes sp.]